MKPKRTILCVNQNEQALSICRLMLETRGYKVAGFASQPLAWERFLEGGIDLVVHHIPAAASVEEDLVARIKAVSPATPAIALYNPQRPPAKQCLADLLVAEGMITPAELLERIHLLLMRRRPPRAVSAVRELQAKIG
jgi:DNA-binding NtrC family response regulator